MEMLCEMVMLVSEFLLYKNS